MMCAARLKDDPRLHPLRLVLQVGSDDDGYAVRVPLSCYLDYMADPRHGGRDDSPLYIFDGTFADRDGSKSMRQDYEVGQRHALIGCHVAMVGLMISI